MPLTGCCGFECGQFGSAPLHVRIHAGTPTFSTTTFRTGLRSLRLNAAGASVCAITWISGNSARKVGRCYVRFATLPSADWQILGQGTNQTVTPGVMFKQSDSKIYAHVGGVMGASGVSVTTGVWYRIDFDININVAGTDAMDVQVDGTVCGQATGTGASSTTEEICFGSDTAVTVDMFVDDFAMSNTSGDYPIGAGYVDPYTCTADGTHNIAGTADFRRSLTATDILNATTDAYLLVDDVPLKALSPTEFINMLAPVNATDYVECRIGPVAPATTPTTGPRIIDCLALVAQAATTTGNMEIRLNDNGTMGIVYTATGVAGIIAGKYVRAAFADPPSAATTWHALNDGSNGDIRDLRVRFGSPAVLDVVPDQYFASFMVEMEFAEVAAAARPRATIKQQAIVRAANW